MLFLYLFFCRVGDKNNIYMFIAFVQGIEAPTQSITSSFICTSFMYRKQIQHNIFYGCSLATLTSFYSFPPFSTKV